MTAGTTQPNIKPLSECGEREPQIEVVGTHVTRMKVTEYHPRTDLRTLPKTERVPLDKDGRLAADVWLSVETVGETMYVYATVYGCRLWHPTDARKYRESFVVNLDEQLAAERRALMNV